MSRLVKLALCIVLLGAPPARADVICLADGRIFEGVNVKRQDDGYLVFFDHGDVLVPPRMVIDCVIEDEVFVPQTDEEREKLEKGYVRFDGKWMTVGRRDKMVQDRIEERKAEIEQLRNVRLWRNRHREETKNFEFEATVPPHIFEEFRDMMEDYFQDFMKDWKVRPPRDAKRLRVCFYGDQENYMQVTGVSRYVLGYFRFVDPMELNIFYERKDPRLTEEVMYHEANHYLQKLINVEFSYPHWPGEALAEYYAGVVRDDKGRLTFGQILPGRLAEVKDDIALNERIGIRDLILEDRYEDYNWGWTLVHFLMSTNHEKRFRKFYVALANGRDVERSPGPWGLETVSGRSMLDAFIEYMDLGGEEGLRALEKEWHEYIDTLEVEDVRGYEAAAWKSLGGGKTIKARRFLKLAIDAGTENPRTYHSYASLIVDDDDDKGGSDKAVDCWLKAIELDPMTADYYIGLGKAMLEKKDEEAKAEGERLLRLALDIEPENLWLEKNLPELIRKSRKD